MKNKKLAKRTCRIKKQKLMKEQIKSWRYKQEKINK